MTADREPQTEAGRALAGWDIANSDEEQAALVDAILAIEAEARADAARETFPSRSVERRVTAQRAAREARADAAREAQPDRLRDAAAVSYSFADRQTAPPPAGIDVERLAEIVSDSLAATTEGTDWAEAPEPSDEPGSPYVLRLTNEIAARLAPQPTAVES